MENKNIAFTGVVTALMIVSTFIKIPVQPVPVTFQPFVVLIIPMLFGIKISFSGLFIYLVMGLLGLPVFANGGGPAYILQPTFGYLVGFMLSTIPVGFFSQKYNTFKGRLTGGVIGLMLIYLLGVAYLYININFIQHTNFPLSLALKLGFLLPIGFDIIKLILASVIAGKLKSR